MEQKWVDIASQKVKLLKLPPQAVGHHIIQSVPTAESHETIGEIRNRVLEILHKLKSVNYVYVLSKNHTLIGVFSFSKLFTEDSESKAGDIMEKEITYSHPQVDQERVVHLALKHNIKSVPIVDENRHFLGIIPSDRIHSILYHEYREDVLRSVGIMASPEKMDDLLKISALVSFRHRIPWILFGLVGGILVAGLMGFFEQTLRQNIILAAFIPLVVYISAAVGAQTQALFIRDLAFHAHLPILKYAAKQTTITLLMAATCGALIAGIVAMFWQEAYLGLVIGFSATVSISSSAILSMLVPYLLFLNDQDPANGSGPFATILQDMLSIIIFFTIATLML